MNNTNIKHKQKHILLTNLGPSRGIQFTYKERRSKNKQHYGQKKKYKKRSTKTTHKTKDRATRTPLKTRCELGYSGRVSSSWFTSDTRRVNLVTNLVISHA
jgi:hypothetical protein